MADHAVPSRTGIQIKERKGGTCEANNGFCPDWIADNLDRYVDPFFQHVFLTVGVGLDRVRDRLRLALLAHRKRWSARRRCRRRPRSSTPSPAWRCSCCCCRSPAAARSTALVALVSYTLIFIFVNVTTGLENVPEESVDAARGMGLTERQLLWRVEVPLALPEIFAGLRIAATTTVGLAALAFFAGAGGLGEEINADNGFQSNVAVAGGLAIAAGRSCWT